MKTAICRLIQLPLLALYAIGMLIIILWAFGTVANLISYFATVNAPDFDANLAQVGLGAILTYVAKNAERLLVTLIKPCSSKNFALLERPISSFFLRHTDET